MGLRQISASRLVAIFLAAQTAITSAPPLALGQEPEALSAASQPGATWALTSINEHLASIFEITRESDGAAISMADLFAGRATPARSDALQIRALSDDILPTDFVYRLALTRGRMGFLSVHRKTAVGAADPVPLTGTPLSMPTPSATGASPEAEDIVSFLEQQRGFLVGIRTLAGLERNYEDVSTLVNSTRDSTTFVGLLGLSLVLVVASVGSAMLGTKNVSLRIAHALMIAGVVLALTSTMSLGNATDHELIKEDLKSIDSQFEEITQTLPRGDSGDDSLAPLEAAMSARALALLGSAHVDGSSGHLRQSAANTSFTITSIFVLIPIVAVATMSQNGHRTTRLLAPAAALVFGLAAALWATAPTRTAKVKDPRAIRAEAEAEIDGLLGSVRR